MRVTEQYSPVALFLMLCKVVIVFETVDEILKCDSLLKQNILVILFIMLYKVVPSLDSVD